MIAFPSAMSAVRFAEHTQEVVHQAQRSAQLGEDTLPLEVARTTTFDSSRGLRSDPHETLARARAGLMSRR